MSDFCTNTSPDVFEETGCAVYVKLTPIFEMVECSEVENINLLKVDGVIRKAKFCENMEGKICSQSTLNFELKRV